MTSCILWVSSLCPICPPRRGRRTADVWRSVASMVAYIFGMWNTGRVFTDCRGTPMPSGTAPGLRTGIVWRPPRRMARCVSGALAPGSVFLFSEGRVKSSLYTVGVVLVVPSGGGLMLHPEEREEALQFVT